MTSKLHISWCNILFLYVQLIRTTFWTRKDRSHRPEESIAEVDREQEIIDREEERKEMDALVADPVDFPAQESTEALTGSIRYTRSVTDCCCRYMMMGYNWFCGYNYSPKQQMKLAQFEVRRDILVGHNRYAVKICYDPLIMATNFCITPSRLNAQNGPKIRAT